MAQIAIVTAFELNVRVAPYENAKIVDSVKRNDRLDVIEVRDIRVGGTAYQWVHVPAGWVWGQGVRVETISDEEQGPLPPDIGLGMIAAIGGAIALVVAGIVWLAV